MPQAPASRSIPTKILLPIDFSPSSDAALEIATDLAQHFRAQLHLLNVIPMLPVVTGVDYFPETTFPLETTYLQESKDRAEQKLAKCIGALISRGVKASSNVEIGNDVVGNIMTVIESEHIDMVVLSTHGISGWRPLVFGSIAEKVIRLVQCPLLLLRSVEPVATLPVPAPDLGKSR
jgi:nucleotide-binding universal stress UspA family protein